MGYASTRHTASLKQLGKIRHLAAEIGEGDTLVFALARDARIASIRKDPMLLGYPVTDDLQELSMFEASGIIRTLSEAVAERANPPVMELKPEAPGVITLAEIMAEGPRHRAADGDPLGAELAVWGLG